jgi:cob(I)alamin adenosyltransferase
LTVGRRRQRGHFPCPCTFFYGHNQDVKIYTRTGDGGDTGLFDGTRVPKSDPRVAAYGDVDELNAWLGLARASLTDPELSEMLERIQRDLFAIGARLADPAHRIAGRVTKAAVSAADVTRLEQSIDALEATLPPLRRFILAGGSTAGATLHVARTVCRRAERAMVALMESNGPDAFEPELLTYVNRLSDLLFVMARTANLRAGSPELEW